MSKRIVYGVLNWGLGHATRSKLVINELLNRGFEVLVVSDGECLEWLRTEFPQLEFFDFPAYNVRYSKKNSQWLKLALQLPKINIAVKRERALLRDIVKDHKVDGIISDNRLGFYHPEVPSVYISHQLKLSFGWASTLASLAHAHFINNFNQLWIPDTEDHLLAGDLSVPNHIKIPFKYVGPLSHFNFSRSVVSGDYIVAVLSGPEPQRTLLENKILEQWDPQMSRLLLVRGSNETGIPTTKQDNIMIYPRLETDRLQSLISGAQLIISRSGYSSIMDYYKLDKNALLIPTPGQGEQEYLAKHLFQQNRFYSVKQKNLKLSQDLAKASTYFGFSRVQQKHELANWDELFSLF
tara:strand:- start:6840 stop:7895 length:1056 start_codon:yes stop_codon:yes gene_type:complete